MSPYKTEGEKAVEYFPRCLYFLLFESRHCLLFQRNKLLDINNLGGPSFVIFCDIYGY